VQLTITKAASVAFLIYEFIRSWLQTIIIFFSAQRECCGNNKNIRICQGWHFLMPGGGNMTNIRRLLVSLPLLMLWAFAMALEVNGVEIPEQVVQPGSQQQLVLNGAGTREKFIFDIYVGALYLTEKSTDAAQILASTSPKRVSMDFLYSEISQKKMVNAWNEGFADNLSDDVLAALKSEINQFNSAFGMTVKGDSVVIDYLGDGTTVVTINDEEKTRIASTGFQRALLSIWLGDSPVDDDLKRAMLGQADE